MRILLLSISILIGATAFAQVPQWTLHPIYDKVKPLESGYYVVIKDGKYGMLDANEKEVIPLKYEGISEFNSHCGLLFDTDKFIGYTTDRGEVTDLSNLHYKTVTMDCFSDGYLAVYNHGGYFYLCAENNRTMGPYAYANPFCEGYGWAKVPKSTKHILDGAYTFQLISAKTSEKISLALGEYEEDDIDFISSVSGGKCIIVLKKRFYEYDVEKEELTPLATDNDPNNKKTRVLALERPVKVTPDGNDFYIQFKQGTMTFDPLMRLTSITYTGQPTKQVEIPQKPIHQPESTLQAIAYNGTKLLGIKYNGKEVLPAQFDDVGRLWGDHAVVIQKGKYGVITIDPDSECRFSLNAGRDVGFEHRTINTDIKVVCPPYIKLPLLTMSSQDENCQVNVDTRKENVNVETAVLSYECSLNIPDEIGLERTPSSVKFSLNYDGLKFTPAIIPFNTWYINNYTVQMLSHQVTGSMLTAEIMVRNTGRRDGLNYFRDVNIEASDSTICSYSKVTEELFTARLYGWKESPVRFSVDITEDGCPTITYPFSIPVKVSATASKDKDKPVEETPDAVIQSQGTIKSSKAKKTTKRSTNTKTDEPKIRFVPGGGK